MTITSEALNMWIYNKLHFVQQLSQTSKCLLHSCVFQVLCYFCWLNVHLSPSQLLLIKGLCSTLNFDVTENNVENIKSKFLLPNICMTQGCLLYILDQKPMWLGRVGSRKFVSRRELSKLGIQEPLPPPPSLTWMSGSTTELLTIIWRRCSYSNHIQSDQLLFGPLVLGVRIFCSLLSNSKNIKALMD